MGTPRYRQGRSPTGQTCFVILDAQGQPTQRYCFSEEKAQEIVRKLSGLPSPQHSAPPARSNPPKPRGQAAAARPAPKEDIYDPEDEQIRRIRLALFEKFASEGYSKYKSISVQGRTYGPGQPLEPEDAKQLAFQMAGRRTGSRFLQEGTNRPTAESRVRAYDKLASDDAEDKRQRYEQMLAVGRKSGPYRITYEQQFVDHGPLVWKIQPGGHVHHSRESAEAALARLRGA